MTTAYGHKMNLPSCIHVTWQQVRHKIYLPGCLSRRQVCHKINLLSCLLQQQFSHKRNLLSCLAWQQECHTVNNSNCFEARWHHSIMCDFDTCQTNCEGQLCKAGRFEASQESKVNPINQNIAKFVNGRIE